MRSLLDGTIGLIRRELQPGRGSCTVAFAEEVVRQVAHPLGADPAADRRAVERSRAEDVLALIRAAFVEGLTREAAARRLADDATMLAAFFQNLDLLEECGRGHAAAVATLVAAALEAPSA